MTDTTTGEKKSKTLKKLAFALGGLGGNNARGAGFLQAALDEAVEPEMITCTTGQIYWVYRYLETQERFFDCVFEDMKVFDRAYDTPRRNLRRNKIYQRRLDPVPLIPRFAVP